MFLLVGVKGLGQNITHNEQYIALYRLVGGDSSFDSSLSGS